MQKSYTNFARWPHITVKSPVRVIEETSRNKVMTHCCDCSEDGINWEKILSFIARNESPAPHPVCPQPTQDTNPICPLVSHIRCYCGCANDLDQPTDSVTLQNNGTQMNYQGPLPNPFIATQSCHCIRDTTPNLRHNLGYSRPCMMVHTSHNMTQRSRCEMTHLSQPYMGSLSRHSLVLHSRNNMAPHSVHSLDSHSSKKETQPSNRNMPLQSCPTMAYQSSQSMAPHACHNMAVHSHGLSHHLVAQTSHSVGLQPGTGMAQPLQVRYNFSRIIYSSSEPSFGPLPPSRPPSQANFSIQSHSPLNQGEECRVRTRVSNRTGEPGPATDLHAGTSSMICNAAVIEPKHSMSQQGNKTQSGTPVQMLQDRFAILDRERRETSVQRKRTKKPLNAFLLFMRENREEVRKELGISNSAVVNMALGEKWNKMTSEEQALYYEQAYFERRLYYSDSSNSNICQQG
ncbi:transcription factor 7-like 1-B isoform X3 [Synchiropus splendidus]|uniref:transcription factor 7-like 1-B isoform X3 n=1 Tax=Synchiropus splendidus TaxID=270530 RepID=UPI00237DF675|nr:transcription factor 7-like 1-B isoform X3 [Synchiropus splendidus]